jgi:uncharacterized protein YegL
MWDMYEDDDGYYKKNSLIPITEIPHSVMQDMKNRSDLEETASAMRKLFGSTPNDKVEVTQKFTGTLTTYTKESSVYWRELFAWLQATIEKNSEPHPFDNRYKQVPAKVLIAPTGQLIILLRDGVEIILPLPMSELSGMVVVNEYRKL